MYLSVDPRLVQHPPNGFECDIVSEGFYEFWILTAFDFEDALANDRSGKTFLVGGINEECSP